MQVLGDLLTMRDELSVLEDRSVAFIGDGNNVAASLALGTALTGMRFIHAAPHGYDLSHEVVEKVGELGGSVEVYRSAHEAVEGADVVYTDTWASMGEEAMAAEKELAFADFQVDEQVMALAGEKAIFLHCLPAKRGKEVIDPVIDGPQSRVWQQAENRMHSARGLLAWLSQWHQEQGHQKSGHQTSGNQEQT
jgi:ornithine carbamoyltransferase